MSKVRVYEVARELGLDHRELMQRMAGLGIQVRNRMSVLDPLEVSRLKRSIDKARAGAVVEEQIRPTVVRRRAKPKPVAAVVVPEPVVARPLVAPPKARVAKPKAPKPVKVEEPKLAVAPEPIAAEPVVARPALAPPPAAEPAPEVQVPVAAAMPTAKPPVVREPEPEVAAEPAPRAEESGYQVASASAAPPADDRFSQPYLAPGVTRRGKTEVPGAIPLSDEERLRIVNEHTNQQGGPRKRREIRSGAGLGPPGRRPAQRGKKRLAHGKKGKATEITVPSAKKRLIRIEDQIQLQELAGRMSLKAVEVLMKLMQMGVSGVHINSTLDADTAALLAEEFGYELENVARTEDEIVGDARGEFEDDDDLRAHRPPIVTVMGHVDHGKTSLLDRIRKEDVASGEAGGITQHIGAYRVDTARGTVVFLDTPGHEAFTAMRARGAQTTDIVILVVAADDGVMPQTLEAVNHSKAAGVPMVVAVNKIDRPDANSEKVMNELAALGLTPEVWGGDTMYIECSAVTGQGVDELLNAVVLQAEVLELTANPNIPAAGVVLEAYLDRGRGPVANVLVRDGTLRTGDFIVAGGAWGRVRAMTDDRGKQVKEALPATPVEVLGLSDLPAAGDSVYQVTDAKKAQTVAEGRRGAAGQGLFAPTVARGLDQLQQLIQQGEQRELELVVKADVQGSVEALQKSLVDLSTDKVKVRVIHTGVGAITENDVMLASASGAIVLGFNVRPQGKAGRTAKKEGIEIRTYSVIYEAIDEVKAAMAGLLAPKLVEKELGKAEVRQTFPIPKGGTIAGSFVTEGKITRAGKARLVRDGIVVWEGGLSSLRRFKEDVREVAAGYECGIGLSGYNDMKERDVIELYEIEEVQATLEDE